MFDGSVREFEKAANGFRSAIILLSGEATTPGTVDPSTGFLLVLSEQLSEDAREKYGRYPHDSFRALGWLQQAFFLCRAFESEQLIEKVIPFEAVRSRVGSARAEPDGRTWGDLTSPSTMLNENLKYGTFTFNFDLHGRFLEEVNRGKFVHALVLICDSAKHGVMSPILNLAMTAHVEQVYMLGFNAAVMAILAFSERHGFRSLEGSAGADSGATT